MRRGSIGLFLAICWVVVSVVTAGSDSNPIPDGVEMIVWEHQNWETNGGFARLTIWNDGRSEVVVAPLRYAHGNQENLRPRKGWARVKQESPPHVEFVRRNIYPPDIARRKFQEALAAGIHLLESFKPGFVDGSGTRVVIQTGGQQKETVIPMFMDREKGTLNYRRFLAVSKILDGFDTSAYDIVPR
jgi:hypothetical protein